jgi:hypothetical protein
MRVDGTMPELNNEQIQFVSRAVAEFISDQRATFMDEAKPLSVEQQTTVKPFFDDELLESARVVVLTDRRVANPRLYIALRALGFHNLPDFSTMAAITFENIVVAHGALADGTLFHELVHAEQYRQLGVARFAELYVRGFLSGGSYYGIPLELNAFALERRFETDRTLSFSVTWEVSRWIEEGRP